MSAEPPPHYTSATPEKSKFDFKAWSVWILAIVAIVIALTGAYFWGTSNSSTTEVEILIPTPSPLVVQVAGEVQVPGIYELNADGRVITAIEAAGGTTERADLSNINLAAFLTDGERIHIPAIRPTSAPMQDTAASSVEKQSSDDAEAPAPVQSTTQVSDSLRYEPVNLNTANLRQLEALPGIGVTRARQIIAMRDEVGSFTSLEQLLEINGIGDKTIEAIRPLVVVR